MFTEWRKSVREYKSSQIMGKSGIRDNRRTNERMENVEPKTNSDKHDRQTDQEILAKHFYAVTKSI